MFCRGFVLAALVAAALGSSDLAAEDSAASPEAIQAAIARSLPLLEKGSARSAERRTCFTCHNQALPVLALAEARNRGLAIDEENFDRQLQHTAEHLARGRENYLQGRGQGGRAISAGYALWTLEAGGWTPDETTEAVAGYLLQYQKEQGRWSHPGHRPPSSGSDFTTSFVALRGLQRFGTPEQRAEIAARTEAVRQWALDQAPADTEDQVFRLKMFRQFAAGDEYSRQAAAELLDGQRMDGGWAQTPEMASDAYATGSALVALLSAGNAPAGHPAVKRGVRYLLDTQLPDGSWRVVTRAEGFQAYFDSGFPHGEDQFISIAASSWATLALLLALPPPG